MGNALLLWGAEGSVVDEFRNGHAVDFVDAGDFGNGNIMLKKIGSMTIGMTENGITVITPDPGKAITDGEIIADDVVYPGIFDTPERWYDCPLPEYYKNMPDTYTV